MTIESLAQDLEAAYEGSIHAEVDGLPVFKTGPNYWVQKGDILVEHRWADHKPTGAEKPYDPPEWYKDRFWKK